VTPPDLATQVGLWASDGESDSLEFKSSVDPQSERLLDTVCAFANGQGGVVLVGVDDKTRQIIGLVGKTAEEEISRLTDMIRNRVRDDPHPEVRACKVQGQTVLVVRVPAGVSAPYGVYNKTHPSYFIRRNSHTYEATPSEIKEFVASRLPRQESLGGLRIGAPQVIW
jgi:predicted HTH transcriptional regulator